MIRQHSFIYRLGTALALTGITTFAVPMTAISAEAQKAYEAKAKADKALALKAAQMKPSCDISANDLRAMRGKSGPNPYLSGSAKWGVNIDGVDITTGNLSLSATDLSFEGGYGIPVNVTRTYSANNPDEGPLGIGWTLSVDLRTTAGGLLKSGGAPDRSVPVAMKERPSDQIQKDGGTLGVNEPISAMLGTDASGREETIQRDVDGIMMPPAWDQNVIETEYETLVLDSDEVYQIAKSQTVTTPEGTVYHYEKQGEYVRVITGGGGTSYTAGGSADFRDQPSPDSSTREPSNVLKIASVADRHGNVTTYSYDESTWVYYDRANGKVREHRLSSISMPGGRALYFSYFTGDSAGLLSSVADFNSGSGRTVHYTFDTGYLATFESAGGKTTEYHYSTFSAHGTTTTAILDEVTDPRGLTTVFRSCLADITTPVGYMGTSVYTYGVRSPNGLEKRFNLLDDEEDSAGTFIGGYYNGTIPRIAHSANEEERACVVYVNDPPQMEVGWELPYRMLTSYDWGTASDGDLATMDEGPFISILARRTPFNGVQVVSLPFSRKVYSAVSQNLLREEVGGNMQESGLRGSRKTTWYNFRGQPLRERVEDGALCGVILDPPVPDPDRIMVTDYAYWGRSKYFQQKAVRGPFQEEVTDGADIRYSFTDYYDDQAADGKKGQTYRVYRSGVDSNVSNEFGYTAPGDPGVDYNISDLPEGVDVGDTYWKRTMEPLDAIPAAEFDYDSDGRVTSVLKLQKVVSGTPTYVETTTTYGSSGSPTWGMPTEVVEDAGGINRTTTTDEYDRSGRAVSVTDGNGRTLRTNYDDDGLVLSIDRWDSGNWNLIVENTYNELGQLTVVSDLTQYSYLSYSYGEYDEDHVGKWGQVVSVDTATDNEPFSEVTYTYDDFGRRKSMETVGVNTPRKFEYRNYEWVGMPGQEQPVFTNMVEDVKVSGVWVPSKEEYSYSFDMSGRLLTARFAPSVTASDWDNDTRSWYGDVPWGDEGSNSMRPSSYASQRYVYDLGGRLDTLVTEWNKWNSSTDKFVVTTIRSAEYEYDGDFKLRSGFALKDGSSTLYTDSYGYDPKLDYLTGETYSGLSGDTRSWTYDAAGNRSNTGYAYDNLNRMTNSPGSLEYDYDTVGNRTARSDNTTYSWDEFNRMIFGYEDGYDLAYFYLPNGLRSTKIGGDFLMVSGFNWSGFYDQDDWTNWPTTRYRYDGQMTLEEDVTYSNDPGNNYNTNVDETRYTPGARGIESIVAERIDGSASGGVAMHTPYRTFPIYDGHGNMIATLQRDGSDFYTLGAEKRYNAWGGVIASANTGSHKLIPNKAYCASLGHTVDGESGLIYMRARYYEPWTGRFISEDPDLFGINWYTYCDNNPIDLRDFSGRFPGSMGDQGAADAGHSDLEQNSGGSALNFKTVAQNKIKSIFTSQKYNGKSITDAQAREIIHALKDSEGLGPADDLLYDFAKQMFGRATGEGIECLGTLRQIIELFI